MRYMKEIARRNNVSFSLLNHPLRDVMLTNIP